MVKLIPDTISPEVKSPAEKSLFHEFREHQTSRKYVILHSLEMTEHIKKPFGEIDYVVLCNEGVLCLEVKGGTVERKDGMWTFTNRYGKPSEPKREGPFKQVDGNMHSLQEHLVKRVGERDAITGCLYANAVLMPDCVFKGSGPDINPDILFDARRQWNLDIITDRAFTYWRNRWLKQHRSDKPRLTDDDIDRLAMLLRGDFQSVPSLKAMVSRAEKELCALTDEQYEILESLADNPRTLVSGVAGSGKTLLAAEQARRAFWEGKDVLYLCYNHHIAEYLAAVFKKENANITAMTLAAFMMQACEAEWTPELDNTWYTKTLPGMFLERAQVPDFDLVVIDEGQDLLKDCYLPCLGRLIRNGFEGGNWAVYYDPNQNIYGTAPELLAALDTLKTRASTISWRLNINCRNTRQVAEANILTSNICEQGRTKVSGPHAEYIPYASGEEEKKKINEIIRNLKSEGFTGKDSVILSKYRLENPKNGLGVKGLDRDLGTIKCKGQMWEARRDEVRFSTIFAFKGLEASVVILADVDSFSDEDSKLLNYVAISRACTKIYILYAESAEAERQKMIASGAKHIVGG